MGPAFIAFEAAAIWRSITVVWLRGRGCVVVWILPFVFLSENPKN
jgi:hypothetical protein